MNNNRQGMISIALGIVCILSALTWTGRNCMIEQRGGDAAGSTVAVLQQQIPDADGDVIKLGSASSIALSRAVYGEEIPDFVLDPTMDMPLTNIGGILYLGYLDIPALELQLPIAANCDDFNLKYSPCRYAGSAYLGDLVIVAHNFSSHFGNIHSLSCGDEVSLTDMDGNIFNYTVEAVETIKPTDVESVLESDFELTLVTCTVGGQNRVCVRCSLSAERPFIASDRQAQ